MFTEAPIYVVYGYVDIPLMFNFLFDLNTNTIARERESTASIHPFNHFAHSTRREHTITQTRIHNV